MKFMGWNWDDLMTCPAELHDEIVNQINLKAEDDELRQLMNS
jgi:hypothetical protein